MCQVIDVMARPRWGGMPHGMTCMTMVWCVVECGLSLSECWVKLSLVLFFPLSNFTIIRFSVLFIALDLFACKHKCVHM